MDNKIRPAYLGGSSDYFYFYGENLKYYDINSLYPFAMLNDMPLIPTDIIIEEDKLKLIHLDDIFGFVKVIVKCPENLKRPVLPIKYKGKTIYPTGSWIGTYFTEELKEINRLNLGYSFQIIEAHTYTRGKIFNKFVEHFFEIKKNSRGVEMFLAILCLNSLYGMFYSSKGES